MGILIQLSYYLIFDGYSMDIGFIFTSLATPSYILNYYEMATRRCFGISYKRSLSTRVVGVDSVHSATHAYLYGDQR